MKERGDRIRKRRKIKSKRSQSGNEKLEIDGLIQMETNRKRWKGKTTDWNGWWWFLSRSCSSLPQPFSSLTFSFWICPSLTFYHSNFLFLRLFFYWLPGEELLERQRGRERERGRSKRFTSLWGLHLRMWPFVPPVKLYQRTCGMEMTKGCSMKMKYLSVIPKEW